MENSEQKPLPDLFIIPDFDHNRIRVSFTAPAKLSAMVWEVKSGAEIIATGNQCCPDTNGKVLFEAMLPGFAPWSVNNPFLYTLSIRIEAQGGDIRVEERFGMKKIEVRDRRIWFNNKPFYVKGVIRGREAHDHPNLMGLSESDYYRKYILAAKACGFNFIRFHSKIPPETFFTVADELGILTHVEIRKYFGKYQKERKAMDDLDNKNPELVSSEEWHETLLRVRNHPSLMIYCMGNEINNPGNNPGVKKISQLTKELDPTRLFIDTCARGQYDRENVDIDVQHMPPCRYVPDHPELAYLRICKRHSGNNKIRAGQRRSHLGNASRNPGQLPDPGARSLPLHGLSRS